MREVKGVQKNTAGSSQFMGTLFTMVLFLVFVMCALFTVLTGGKVYENISARMADNYTGSVALQYIANKVRQSDLEGAVTVRQIDGTSVLELKQELEGDTYIDWIYYYDGSIRELFTYPDSGLELCDGIEILECEGLTLSQDGSLIVAETTGNGGGQITLSLRSAEERR